MQDLITIEIAGVNLSIRCQDARISQKSSSNYNSFLKLDQNQSDPDIMISLHVNDMPDIERLIMIFDSGESWSMFRDTNDYFVVLNPPAFDKKPVWIVRLDPEVKSVHVYFNEMLIHKNNDEFAVTNPLSYPLDQILMMYFFAKRNGALIHAAGLEFNGRGYIFPGKSGAGKSTISRQLTGLDDYEVLSDDRIIVRKMDKTFKAFGTPWPGEAGIAVNKSVDLAGIFFISQASFNKIEEIKPQKALERLLPVVSIPWYDKEVMIKILDFCEDLISNVPLYELHFEPGNEIINVFQNFVSK
jgi:hypothetical protein